jgi:hypothetical protein
MLLRRKILINSGSNKQSLYPLCEKNLEILCNCKWYIHGPLRFKRLGGNVYSWIIRVTYTTNLSEFTKRGASTMPVHLSICVITKERDYQRTDFRDTFFILSISVHR